MAMEFRADLDLGNPEINKRIAHQAVIGSIAVSESPYDSGIRVDLPPEAKVTLEPSNNDYGYRLKISDEMISMVHRANSETDEEKVVDALRAEGRRLALAHPDLDPDTFLILAQSNLQLPHPERDIVPYDYASELYKSFKDTREQSLQASRVAEGEY